MRTKRIWIYWNDSPVRITLNHGQPFALHYGGPTEEGWFSVDISYEYDADAGAVRLCVENSGSDCDGPCGSSRKFLWMVDGPTEPLVGVDWRGDMFDLPEHGPVWESVSSRQYDYFGEKAGY